MRRPTDDEFWGAEKPRSVADVLTNLRRVAEARDADPVARAKRDEVAARAAREDAAWERKRRHELRAQRLEGVAITEDDVSILVAGEPRETRSLCAVRDWDPLARPVLVLCGTVGRGKTFAGAWLLAELGGRYMRARALERLFHGRYGEQADEQDVLFRVPTLVVDDLGREDDPQRMTAVLLDLVDERRRGHRTLLIHNGSKRAFLESYADLRLRSRLGQSALWVQDRGEDLRGGR